MPIELPPNLHLNCAPVVWLLGTWRGNGHGDYPTIDGFQFGQEIVFQQDGRPFFHYFARSWIVDEQGKKVRDAAQETGFLRCPERGKVELVISHSSGISEIWYGVAEDGKIEMRTAGVSYTESAKPVTGGHRLYGNVDGDLLYAYDMEAVGQELQPHLWARLQRA
ncbi:FABP family protein [Nocardioides sp. GY 10127]|uniref:FABP family protein n=1 Tax=Nocardioides sp. GY 10127 TaxID=2569762 RepID=UPI0010A902E6|nr:FABP family protein [Nocardioides sp. GY 10127]TIC79433.1 FABP family protein [Nocardioides sp. GY 10127]